MVPGLPIQPAFINVVFSATLTKPLSEGQISLSRALCSGGRVCPALVQIHVLEAAACGADILSLLQMPATGKAVKCCPLEIIHGYNG